MNLEIVDYVNKCIENKEDFTIRRNNEGKLLIPRRGYVVSITPLINIGMDAIQMLKYILQTKYVIIEGKEYDLYLGGWFENKKDKLRYDISVVIENKEEAIQIGKHCTQKAIYDISNKNTILLQ